MKIGLLYDLRNPKRWHQPFPEFYAQTLEHMQAMDEMGFASINMTEHHFDEDSYCPTTTIWNAASAVRTKRAMIGQSVLLMPYVHPVRLAEDMTTIDILSNGRAWIQAGEAYRPMEFDAFGVERKVRAGLTSEGMQIMRKCFTEEEFSFTGKHFKLQNVRMTPKPVQKPHPPMFLSATQVGERPMERTVELDLGGATAMGPTNPPNPGAWAAWHAGWTETIRRQGKDPARFQCSTINSIFVTDDPERAWRKHREGILHQANSYRSHGGRSQPVIETPEQIANWREIFQTPNDTAKYIRREYGKNPPTHLLLMAVKPGMTYAEGTEYHRMFVDKVLPQIRDLIG